MTALPEWAQQELLEQLENAIRAMVPDDEVLVHFDVCVSTRRGSALDKIKYRRYSPSGSDPGLSLALLDILRLRLQRRLLGE
jgi:hypothetical protein